MPLRLGAQICAMSLDTQSMLKTRLTSRLSLIAYSSQDLGLQKYM